MSLSDHSGYSNASASHYASQRSVDTLTRTIEIQNQLLRLHSQEINDLARRISTLQGVVFVCWGGLIVLAAFVGVLA